MPQLKNPASRKVPIQRAVNGEIKITDEVVRMMLHDTRFLNQFPFLKQVQAQTTSRKGCGSCGTPRARMTGPNLAKLRQQLANMPAARKIKLKQLLNVKQVTIRYPGSGGVPVLKRF